MKTTLAIVILALMVSCQKQTIEPAPAQPKQNTSPTLEGRWQRTSVNEKNQNVASFIDSVIITKDMVMIDFVGKGVIDHSYTYTIQDGKMKLNKDNGILFDITLTEHSLRLSQNKKDLETVIWVMHR